MHTKKLLLPTIVMTSLFGLVACGYNCGSSDSSGSDNAINKSKPVVKKEDSKNNTSKDKKTTVDNGSKNKTPIVNNKPKENKPINKGGSSSSGEKEVKFYFIDDSYSNNKAKYVELVEYVVRDGSIKPTYTQIIGEHNKAKSDENDYYLAPNFEAVIPDEEYENLKEISKTTKVFSANSFSWQAKSKTGKALTISMKLDEIDISGKTEKDTNFHLDTPRLHNTKISYAMPKGSSCYVMRVNYDFPHFAFDDNNISSYKSVQEWYDFKSKYLGSTLKLLNKKTLKVGDNNQYTATYLQIAKTNPNDGTGTIDEYPAIIEYKGKLYTGTYLLKEEYQENTDPSKGEVYCDNYNQTGAEYLVNLAKKYEK